MPTPATLLLVGGGHAHVEVLRRLALARHPPARVLLLSPDERHHYSGMAPGYVAGLYAEDELAFDLAALARRAGAELVLGRATGVDPAARRVILADGRSLPYDLVSFDVGSVAAGTDVPGVAEHALSVKPLSKAVTVRRRLEELAADGGDGGRPRRVVVVGGGAAGVEVAFAAARQLDDAGAEREITLLEAGPRLLAQYDEGFHAKARRALAERSIRVETEVPVLEVEAGAVRREDGSRVPSDLTLWLTGPAAPPLFAGSGLPLDPGGYLLVDATLRAPGHDAIFAAGDCATLASRPDTPKAGVYAVRQAPHLWASLAHALAGRDPRREGVLYQPQRGFLSLLNTCDGRALLAWKGFSAHAGWAWWLKDSIDRRFMRRYQRLA
jgi:selenide,water dikinase